MPTIIPVARLSLPSAPHLTEDIASQLERLQDLHLQGALSDSEFLSAKALVLSNIVQEVKEDIPVAIASPLHIDAPAAQPVTRRTTTATTTRVRQPNNKPCSILRTGMCICMLLIMVSVLVVTSYYLNMMLNQEATYRKRVTVSGGALPATTIRNSEKRGKLKASNKTQHMICAGKYASCDCGLMLSTPDTPTVCECRGGYTNCDCGGADLCFCSGSYSNCQIQNAKLLSCPGTLLLRAGPWCRRRCSFLEGRRSVIFVFMLDNIFISQISCTISFFSSCVVFSLLVVCFSLLSSSSLLCARTRRSIHVVCLGRHRKRKRRATTV